VFHGRVNQRATAAAALAERMKCVVHRQQGEEFGTFDRVICSSAPTR
jgi:hypothetical protein